MLAIGKLGDKRALEVLAGAAEVRAARAAAADRRGDLPARHQLRIAPEVRRRHDDASRSPTSGFQDLLRAASRALGALAASGRQDAAADAARRRHPGARSRRGRRWRSPSARVALRNTPLTLKVLEARADSSDAALVLRDAFDMLEEDYEEERFFATVRRGYWQAPAGSPDAQARRRADPGAGVLTQAERTPGLDIA